MLGVPRCVEVDDGSYVYLDPSLHVVWNDGLTIVTPEGKLRIIYHDSTQVLRRKDAEALVADGLAAPVGGRLFEQPELMDSVFAWDNTSEIDFIVRSLGSAAAGRGIEFGCGTGRILRRLREHGLSLDGVDASEIAVRYLREQLGTDPTDDTVLMVADIAACAFAQRYTFAIAGLNTLRYLPTVSALRRHLHLAALSVRTEGVYLIMVDTWMAGATPADCGSFAEWPATLPDGRRVRVAGPGSATTPPARWISSQWSCSAEKSESSGNFRPSWRCRWKSGKSSLPRRENGISTPSISTPTRSRSS